MVEIEDFEDLEDYKSKSEIIAELILGYIILLEVDQGIAKEREEEFHLSHQIETFHVLRITIDLKSSEHYDSKVQQNIDDAIVDCCNVKQIVMFHAIVGLDFETMVQNHSKTDSYLKEQRMDTLKKHAI